MFSNRTRFLPLFILLFSIACSSRRPAPPRRLAVLRFENLSPYPSLDWVGRALSESLIRQGNLVSPAAAGPVSAPRAPGISAELGNAFLAGATAVLTGYYTSSGAGRVTVHATEEDAATGKTIGTYTEQGPPLDIAAALSRKLGDPANPPLTDKPDALRAYSEGLDSAGPKAASSFERSAGFDPNFGAAYLAWARTLAAAGDRSGLETVLARARRHSSAFAPLDRAGIDLESATASNDRAGRIGALRELTAAQPGAANLRTLADEELAARDSAAAARDYAKAAALEPSSPELQNLLAYSRMFAGDYPGALEAVRRYRALRPQDPNALDSEGDIHFYFGKFTEAERVYLQAFQTGPNFSGGVDGWKAARARLMTGDVTGATALADRYLDVRRKARDPLASFRAAEWRYLTGDRAPAMRDLASAAQAAADPDVRALAWTQAAIWQLVAGDRPAAERLSQSALSIARPGMFVSAAIARYLAQPGASPAEWRARAEKQFHGGDVGAVRQLALAYAFLLGHHWPETVAAWKAIYAQATPNDQPAAFFYAASLVGAGRARDAAPLFAVNPIPPPAPGIGYESLYFPALFQWRGDAESFRKLGGTPTPAK